MRLLLLIAAIAFAVSMWIKDGAYRETGAAAMSPPAPYISPAEPGAQRAVSEQIGTVPANDMSSADSRALRGSDSGIAAAFSQEDELPRRSIAGIALRTDSR